MRSTQRHGTQAEWPWLMGALEHQRLYLDDLSGTAGSSRHSPGSSIRAAPASPDTPTDNYTDNSLEFFSAYQVKEGADPNGPLVQKGVTNHTLKDLRDDAVAGRLAQVSWIVAPYKYCEHPEASPTDGAYFIHKVLEALTENPEVWSRTVLFLNYDENDGLFDHVVPPMPPLSSEPEAGGMVSSDLASESQRRTARPGSLSCGGASPSSRLQNRGAAADWVRATRSDDHRLSLDAGRLGLLPGIRPHLRSQVS